MKRFFTIAALAATLLSLNSCTSINRVFLGKYDPVKSATIDLEYDKAWERVVDLLAELAIPIGVIDKESGIVTSSEAVFVQDVVGMENKYGHILPNMWFVVPYNNRAWECGAKCFFNIRLKKLDNGKTYIQVNFNNLRGFYQYRTIEAEKKYPSTSACTSTGNFEKRLIEYLQE